MKSIKGAIGEHKVIVQLLEDGYQVAVAVDPQCPFDLIAVDEEGDCRKFDVKTVSRRKDRTKINRVLTSKQKKLGIELIEVG